MHRIERSLAAAAAFVFLVAAGSAQAITLQRQSPAAVAAPEHVQSVQYGGGFPVWGGFGDSPRGRPFVAGRAYGSSWWTPRNDYYARRYSYGPRFYYGSRTYGPRYYSRRHLNRGWYR